MLSYIFRRTLYAVPIILGVNILIFSLFFFVSNPDEMARQALAGKNNKVISQESIDNWKKEHSYHLPAFYNSKEDFPGSVAQTIFWQKSVRLLAFQFGKSDVTDTSILSDMAKRIPPSLSITVPMFLLGMFVNIFFAMLIAFYRGTYIDTASLFICVIMMSISGLYYIVLGQFLFSVNLRWFPVSGFSYEFPMILKFIALPVFIGVIMGLGSGIRYYRTLFLEEVNQDHVRTARSKGLGEGKVLFKHVLKNAMLPILTNTVVAIPFLIMGSMLLEKFFGIPGLGGYVIEAMQNKDFSVIRAMVFLSSCLYIISFILVDISYTLVDPRVRLK